jgi:hypothetical protein
LKHPDETFATYVYRQVKHLKHTSETLAKTPEKHMKSHCKNIQHPDKTLAKYVSNICNIQITLATYV